MDVYFRAKKGQRRPKFESLLQTPPEYVKLPKEDHIVWLEGNAGAFRVRDRSEDDGNDCGGSTSSTVHTPDLQ